MISHLPTISPALVNLRRNNDSQMQSINASHIHASLNDFLHQNPRVYSSVRAIKSTLFDNNSDEVLIPSVDVYGTLMLSGKTILFPTGNMSAFRLPDITEQVANEYLSRLQNDPRSLWSFSHNGLQDMTLSNPYVPQVIYDSVTRLSLDNAEGTTAAFLANITYNMLDRASNDACELQKSIRMNTCPN